MEKLFIMLQMLKLNLAEQYIQNLPIGWFFGVLRRLLSQNFGLILFENLFKPQRRLAVYMWLTSSVSSATSKQCFELTSSVSSATSKQCFELTSSVLSTTSKQCFEQPTASFLVCSLIFIEYKNTILREKSLISQILGKRLHSVFYWTIIGWYKAFCSNKM